MKVIILAGGLGTRLQEETTIKPKPMVEIGEKPILWHIMKIYSHYGCNEFGVALGYKGEWIKKYFLNYYHLDHDFSVDIKTGQIDLFDKKKEDWKVHLIDTGVETQTGGRIKRLSAFINNKTFMMTYGDGVGNVDVSALLKFHKSHGKLATVTAVRPPARFGGLDIHDGQVEAFIEKPQIGEGWINGGFFVLEPEVLDYIADDQTTFEREPLEALSKQKQLMAFQHNGYWQPIDTLREVQVVNRLWHSRQAPWKVWRD